MAAPSRHRAHRPYVDADIRQAQTLPPWTFDDPDWLDHELATLFHTSWLAVPERTTTGRGDDARDLVALLRRRGAYAPVTLLDRPYYLHRGFDDTLRLLPNVCTHAWHTLVQGPGRDRKVVCPQHGRVFDDTGAYLRQPGFEEVPDMPRPSDHLRARPVHALGPLLWTCLGTPAVPFDDVLAPVWRSVAHLPWADLERVPYDHEVRLVRGNWKLHAWNYMDALHIPYVHRQPGGLADAVAMDSYRTELHGEAALQWAYAVDPAAGFPPEWLPARFRDPDGDRRVFALWWFLFPTLTLNVYPWGLSINHYQPVPGRPDQTRFHWFHYTWDPTRYADRERLWHLGGVDDEDVDALSQVARGIASGEAVAGRFAPEAEVGPHWFHRRVDERTQDPV